MYVALFFGRLSRHRYAVFTLLVYPRYLPPRSCVSTGSKPALPQFLVPLLSSFLPAPVYSGHAQDPVVSETICLQTILWQCSYYPLCLDRHPENLTGGSPRRSACRASRRLWPHPLGPATLVSYSMVTLILGPQLMHSHWLSPIISPAFSMPPL